MKKTLVIAALVAASSSFALAQDQNPNDRAPRPFGGNFFAAARTEDGKIELAKLPEQLPEEFKNRMKEADKDADGFLTQEELKEVMPMRPQGMRGQGPMGFGGPQGQPGFGPMGFMKDGKLDLSKLPEQMPQEIKDRMKEADKDSDGFLSVEEMRQMGPTQPQGRPGFGPMGFGGPQGQPGQGPMGFGGPQGRPGQGPMGFGAPQGQPGMGPMAGFRMMNRDGKIDLSKLPEQMPQEAKDRMKAADKDGDGFVTPEEMRNSMPRPKFQFPEGKKPDFINDDNAIVVDKLVEAIKYCDKNNDGVVDEEEQKAAAELVKEKFGPSLGMYAQRILGGPQGPMGMGWGMQQGPMNRGLDRPQAQQGRGARQGQRGDAPNQGNNRRNRGGNRGGNR